MLDIIITHYNEPWFICKKQFQMLNVQRIVNWNEIKVTVINDGGNRMPEDELSRMCFPVEQVDVYKKGVSAARNYGIYAGTKEWIMFCDCDDAFANMYALDEMMTEMRKGKDYDVIWTPCMTEFGRIVEPIVAWRIFAFIHGKAYRRQFLLDENILFDERRTYGEDTLFNYDVMAKTNRIKEAKVHAPAYVWIRRGGSVTTKRRNV